MRKQKAKAILQKKECPSCGASVTGDVCEYCGSSFGNAGYPEKKDAYKEEKSEESPKRGCLERLIALGLLLFFFALCMAVPLYMDNEEAIKGFLAQMQEADKNEKLAEIKNNLTENTVFYESYAIELAYEGSEVRNGTFFVKISMVNRDPNPIRLRLSLEEFNGVPLKNAQYPENNARHPGDFSTGHYFEIGASPKKNNAKFKLELSDFSGQKFLNSLTFRLDATLLQYSSALGPFHSSIASDEIIVLSA
jgi:hypothetical protein